MERDDDLYRVNPDLTEEQIDTMSDEEKVVFYLVGEAQDKRSGRGIDEEDLKAALWIHKKMGIDAAILDLLLAGMLKASWEEGEEEPKFTKVESEVGN